MSNEDLVVLIQAGERDKLVELWENVRRFVAVQAHKRLVLSGGLGGVEFRDLYNSGYLALIAAADSFRLDAGRSFISWLPWPSKMPLRRLADIGAGNRLVIRSIRRAVPTFWCMMKIVTPR